MADVTNDLLHDVPKWIQARLANVDDHLGAMDERMDTLNEQMRAFTLGLDTTDTDVANLHRMFGTMDQRLPRIERRLERAEEQVK